MNNFRFNFGGEDGNNDLKINDEQENIIQWLDSYEVVPEEQVKHLDDKVKHAKMFSCGNIEIGHVFVSEALINMEENEFKNAATLAEKEHSDLVAGTYEGGLKIWECTYDLVEYFENQSEINFDMKKVLDLGCGAGILGIYANLKGSTVTFQDYNKEVLEHVTILNCLLNIEDEDKRESELKKYKFYSGDWQSFNDSLPDSESFDIILTSETIYNERNYDKLMKLFLKRLKEDGVVYVAAKTYYFGVGGGTRQFEEAVKNNGLLKSSVIWKSTGGIQREILKIMHNKKENI